MDPLTMSAEQEHADRNMADSFPCNDQRARAWKEIDALRAKLAEVERERDEARAFGERAASAYNLLLMDRKTTCVYCGHEYKGDTPDHAQLTEHISVCAKHPMAAAVLALAAAQADNARLRDLARILHDSVCMERMNPDRRANVNTALDNMLAALSVTADDSALKAHDDEIVERCAKWMDHHWPNSRFDRDDDLTFGGALRKYGPEYQPGVHRELKEKSNG